MDRVERPLSPHLQVYRWQISSVLSILHRLTGVALTLGLPVFVYWLFALASGPQAYAEAQLILGSMWLKLCYLGWSFCFFYHMANGIRHLGWDLGYGFESVQIHVSGWAGVITALVATLVYGSLVIF